MEQRFSYELVDTRQAFRVYAWLAWIAGFALSAWGPMWLGANLPGLPFYKASIIRVIGAIVMATGFFSRAMVDVDDAAVRRSGLLNFVKAFLLVAVILLSQQVVILRSPAAGAAAIGLLVVAFAFALFCVEADVDPAPARESLPSRNARRIREAAGQEERHRLARDLHDSVKQQIFAIQTSAATAQARFSDDPSGAAAALEQVRQSAREAMSEMEAMLDQLRAAPIERAGLVSALKAQCEALGFRTGAQVKFELGDLPADLVLAPGAPQAIFRAAQEALSNVARHARATEVCVRLGVVNRWLKLTISDNGVGFDSGQPARGMGLANMRTRAEEFHGLFGLESSGSAGTKVMVVLPVADPPSLKVARRNAAIFGILFALGFSGKIRNVPQLALSVAFFVMFLRAAMIWLALRRRRESLR